MNKSILLALIAGLGFSLTGCETTGDPTQGGIFWSESKAQDRLRQREDTLDQIHSDTSRVKHRNRELEQQVDSNQ